MREKGVVYRLGWALYWGACIIAVPLALVGLLLLIRFALGYDVDKEAMPAFLFSAFVIWLVGRGIRYVLAGD